MNAYVVSDYPYEHAVHIDFAQDDVRPRTGVMLTLVDPTALLNAAQSARRHSATWVIWNLDAMPSSERVAASFAITLARTVRGEVHIVLDSQTGRRARIVGHLRRAGCEG